MKCTACGAKLKAYTKKIPLEGAVYTTVYTFKCPHCKQQDFYIRSYIYKYMVVVEQTSLEMIIDRLVTENYIKIRKDEVTPDAVKTMLGGGYMLYDLNMFPVNQDYYYFLPHKIYKVLE